MFIPKPFQLHQVDYKATQEYEEFLHFLEIFLEPIKRLALYIQHVDSLFFFSFSHNYNIKRKKGEVALFPVNLK